MEKHIYIYAINRSQVFYTFKVIGETENEFVVKDIETTYYELSQVKFYINKKNLCDARCEEKKWEFIVKEDFFASFNLEDVKKEFNKRQIELILNDIKVYEEKIKELENKVVPVVFAKRNYFQIALQTVFQPKFTIDHQGVFSDGKSVNYRDLV